MIGREICAVKVPEGKLRLTWLGQSGFCIQAPDGTAVLLDPYLTDSISKGYKPYIHQRLLPPVMACDSIPDLAAVLYTHDHMDHMDPNTVVQLLWNTKAVLVASPAVCDGKLKGSMYVAEERLHPIRVGESLDIGMLHVTAVPANHCAGALGFVVECQGQCLYFCGDTQLFYTMTEIGRRWAIDTAFLCFNGQGGNMDVSGAVAAAGVLKAGQIVPVHYGMYSDNNADPDNFELALQRSGSQAAFHVMTPGVPEEFAKRG